MRYDKTLKKIQETWDRMQDYRTQEDDSLVKVMKHVNSVVNGVITRNPQVKQEYMEALSPYLKQINHFLKMIPKTDPSDLVEQKFYFAEAIHQFLYDLDLFFGHEDAPKQKSSAELAAYKLSIIASRWKMEHDERE